MRPRARSTGMYVLDVPSLSRRRPRPIDAASVILRHHIAIVDSAAVITSPLSDPRALGQALLRRTPLMINAARMPTIGGIFKSRKHQGSHAVDSGRRQQKASAKGGNAVSSASGDLGEESVPAELVDETGYVSAATTRLVGVGGRCGPQLILEVTVAESIDEVAARQDGLEQL